MTLEEGEIVNNNWRLKRLVYPTAEMPQAMSEVWLAEHCHLKGQLAAIKVIAADLMQMPIEVERFVKQAELIYPLNHPNIVPLREMFMVDDRHALVMPWVGVSVEFLLNHNPEGLPVQMVLEVSIQILDALNHVHTSNPQIIHRDLKPSNILMHTDGSAMLTDFGIALAVGHGRLTNDGKLVGTADYMSPEQVFAPRDVDHRSDIYSFGCVMYEMLTGETPFQSSKPKGKLPWYQEIQKKHKSEHPPSIRERRDDVPLPLQRLIEHAMNKHPDDRYPSASDFREALTQLKEKWVWDSGGPDLKDLAEPPPPPPPPPPPVVMEAISTPIVLMLFPGAGLAAMLYAYSVRNSGKTTSAAIALAAGVSLMIIGYFYVLHRAWSTLDDGSGKLPRKAILSNIFLPGLGAFPYYLSFLYQFNAFVEEYDFPVARRPQALGMLIGLIAILCTIPFALFEDRQKVAAAVASVVSVFLAIFNFQICEAVNELKKAREMAARTAKMT